MPSCDTGILCVCGGGGVFEERGEGGGERGWRGREREGERETKFSRPALGICIGYR